MNRRQAVLIFAAALAVLAQGCASHQHQHEAKLAPEPAELQTLAMLQPPITLPSPATQPSSVAPTQSLQLYAQGRDALLNNEKSKAIEKFKAALTLDPSAAVVQRDLGYAYLGVENDRALVAFKQLLAINPSDGDARLQVARLLIEKKQWNDAILELRLARLTPDYMNTGGTSAVIDLLLGRLLETQRYRRAALECYENVIGILDSTGFNLRGRPELAELLAKPSVLMLRTADLASACGYNARAIELYQRIQLQEPQAASVLELRIARAELSAGKEQQATRRAFAVVTTFHGSRSIVRAFIELFNDHGGAAEALRQLNAINVSVQDQTTLHVLRAQLLLASGDAKGAISEIDKVKNFDLTAVRTTVHAYRAAGLDAQLLRKLLERTAAQPEQWPVISHGWSMLSQIGQADPLKISQLEALNVPQDLAAAKQFVLSNLYQNSDQPTAARRALESSKKADPRFVHSISQKSDDVSAADLDFATSTDLAALFIDLSDDPSLIESSISTLLRGGQKRFVQEALQLANTQLPTNVVLAALYAQVLYGDQQTTEASNVLDRAAGSANSATELYYLASQYTLIGDAKSGEQALRKAYEKDPQSAAVCNDLGFQLTDEGRDLDFAEQLIWRAAGLEPDNPAYLDSLGWLLYKRGKFDQAVQYLKQALSLLDPVDPTVLDHAGDALYRDKKAEDARNTWQQAVDVVRQRGSSDPQLRLRLENKIRQLDAKQIVDVAPVVEK